MLNLQRDLLSIKQDLQGGQGELLLTPKEIDKKLNKAEDALGDNPLDVLSNFDELKRLVCGFSRMPANAQVKFLGLLSNGLRKLSNLIEVCLRSNDLAEAVDMKAGAESYAYLLFGASSLTESSDSIADKKGGRNDWEHIKLQIAETVSGLFSLQLLRLFESKTDCEALVSCLLRLIHSFLERPESAKLGALRSAALNALLLACHDQGYSHGLKTIILQDLNYFEHLAEFSADLVNTLQSVHGEGQLMEEVLREVGGLNFSSGETAAARIIGCFLERLADVGPKATLRSLPFIISQLDSESHTIRMSVLGVLARLIKHLAQEDRTEQTSAQIKSILQVLEERFRDVSSFVRARLLHVLAELCRTHALPVNRRSRILSLTIERVMDKSSTVRRKAVQLLGELIKAHPFGVDGGELDLTFFQDRLRAIDSMLSSLSAEPGQSLPSPSTPATPSRRMDIDIQANNVDINHGNQSADPNQINALLMQKRYYTDAVRFVEQLDKVVPVLSQLLSSTVKTEVFEVMDFFVDAHTYKLRSALGGVRKMVHLVWEKDLSTEDGTKQSVKDHLVQCYRRIYLDPDERLSQRDKILSVANGLLEYLPLLIFRMVSGLDLPELTSTDELIQVMAKKQLIPEQVIQTIFSIITSRNVSPVQQRSAVLLYAMLGKADRSVVEGRLDGLVRVGLSVGGLGERDPVVAQYCCQAIQSISFVADEADSIRLPNDNVLFTRLVEFIRINCNGPEWYYGLINLRFQTITEAVNAIYLLADRPDVIIGDFVKGMAEEVCHGDRSSWNARGLSKLLFLVGQVALQHSLHLDSIERHWKRQNANSRKEERRGNDGLDQVTAPAEDDIAEVIRDVRENEMLYGEGSLLRAFGPLVAHDQTLQRAATLTLGKFMTVSGRFCKEHLSLLLTIMERSPDPIIRSNMVIAFGDLTHAHNRLVDANLDRLFGRLRDEDALVRRNAMMVLSHLTLCGMIKVRGQVGEIAACLEDGDGHLRDLARTFFAELAGRDNGTAIYNHLPDIISSLSSQLSDEPEKLGRILQFIFEFIKKERQLEAMVEKLCVRLRQLDDPGLLRSTANCLSLLPLSSEKCFSRLIDALPLYQDKLTDPGVQGAFAEVLSKARKLQTNKAEFKAQLDDWESRLTRAAGGELVTGSLQDGLCTLSLANDGKDGMKGESKSRKVTRKTHYKKSIVYKPGMSSGEDEEDELVASAENAKDNVAKRTSSRRSRSLRVVSGNDDGGDDDDD